MKIRVFQTLALVIFGVYVAVLPGSTLTVALDRVPSWGEWMGGALLIAQGAAVLFWLIGQHGRRGAVAAALVLLMAWGVEHIGVTTGFPFGRYSYTDTLQPQFFGVVPLAIACAWLMVAVGAWQLATLNVQTFERSNVRTLAATATLVLLLDLQIETVATKVNPYWIWHDQGPYYNVPTSNFVAWWLVGLIMATVVRWALPRPTLARPAGWHAPARRVAADTLRWLPAALYLLSTAMFVAVNLARGYPLAGLAGLATLLGLGLLHWLPRLGGLALAPPPDAREAE
jgi:putative membrane protein